MIILRPFKVGVVRRDRRMMEYSGLPDDISLHQSCIEQLVIRGVNPIDSYEEPKTVDEQTSFSWENIFYPNRKNDFGMILNDIGQTGVFLVRPQLTKTSSSDHDYVRSDLDRMRNIERTF